MEELFKEILLLYVCYQYKLIKPKKKRKEQSGETKMYATSPCDDITFSGCEIWLQEREQFLLKHQFYSNVHFESSCGNLLQVLDAKESKGKTKDEKMRTDLSKATKQKFVEWISQYKKIPYCNIVVDGFECAPMLRELSSAILPSKGRRLKKRTLEDFFTHEAEDREKEEEKEKEKEKEYMERERGSGVIEKSQHFFESEKCCRF
ncbi:hypothetical protein RFI_30910, partial [Reticulomyxa filosa]